MTQEARVKLKEFAARIEALEANLMFGGDMDEEPMVAFIQEDGIAQQFFLMALSNLETAHRCMKVAMHELERGEP